MRLEFKEKQIIFSACCLFYQLTCSTLDKEILIQEQPSSCWLCSGGNIVCYVMKVTLCVLCYEVTLCAFCYVGNTVTIQACVINKTEMEDNSSTASAISRLPPTLPVRFGLFHVICIIHMWYWIISWS